MSPQTINKLKKTLLILVSLTLFLLIVLYLIKYQDRLFLLLKINRQILVYILLCSLFASFSVAYGFRNLMILFNVPLKFREWIGLSVTNSMYNYILPFQGALLIRAQYLKRKYGFEYSKYAALSGGALLIGLMVASFTSMVLLMVKYGISGYLYKDLLILVGILFFITILISFFLWFIDLTRIKSGWIWLDLQILNFSTGINVFKKNNSMLLIIAVTNLALFFFMGLRLYFSFKAIDVPVGLLEIIVIQAISVFSMILPITPGNLGVREGIIGLISVMLKIRLEDAVLAAALDRVVGMVVIFIFGSIYHFVLMKELKYNGLKKIQKPL